MEPERLLIDTDILIDYLRGQPKAIAYLESLPEPPLLAAITVAELYAGVREGNERKALERFLATIEVVPLDEAIATRGGLYRRDYAKSHNVGLADALIAATAEFRNATVVTLNQKHFPMLSKVLVPYVKP